MLVQKHSRIYTEGASGGGGRRGEIREGGMAMEKEGEREGKRKEGKRREGNGGGEGISVQHSASISEGLAAPLVQREHGTM
jgi:hypothetical protein